MQWTRISRDNTILLVLALAILALVVPLKIFLTPLVLHLAGLCRSLKPYQPERNDRDPNGTKATRMMRDGMAGIDKWVKDVDVPYTGKWVFTIVCNTL